MKRGGTGGFEMTHVETSSSELRELVEQFDSHFEESRQQMARDPVHTGGLAMQLMAFLNEADGGSPGRLNAGEVALKP